MITVVINRNVFMSESKKTITMGYLNYNEILT